LSQKDGALWTQLGKKKYEEMWKGAVGRKVGHDRTAKRNEEKFDA
jgi:hypothetical protein